jgi:hypothetical protein
MTLDDDNYRCCRRLHGNLPERTYHLASSCATKPRLHHTVNWPVKYQRQKAMSKVHVDSSFSSLSVMNSTATDLPTGTVTDGSNSTSKMFHFFVSLWKGYTVRLLNSSGHIIVVSLAASIVVPLFYISTYHYKFYGVVGHIEPLSWRLHGPGSAFTGDPVHVAG